MIRSMHIVLPRFQTLCAVLALLAGIAHADPAADQFNFAEGLFIHKDYASALEEYSGYLKQYPAGEKAGPARYRLAETYFRMERHKEAAAAYDDALAKDAAAPEAELARYNLGRARMALGAHDTALAAFRTAAASQRPDIREEAAVGAGECLLQLKKLDEALTHFTAFLKDFPQSKHRPAALFSLGWAAVESGKFEPAIPPLTELVEKFKDDPNCAKATLLLSDALSATKSYDKAQALLQPLAEKGEAAEDALLRLAWTHYRAGNRAAAAERFLKFADTYKSSPMMPSALYNAGIARYELKDLPGAAAAFARLVTEKPASKEAVDGRFWLGVVQFELGKSSEAAATLAPLLTSKELTGEHRATTLYTYAEALAATGKDDEAAKLFRALLAEFPEGPNAANARYSLGINLAHQGNLAGAVEALEDCLKGKPPADVRKLVLFAIGEYAYRLGKLDRSRAALQELIDAGDTDPRTLYRLGWVSFDQAAFDVAAGHFRKLAALESEFKSEALYMTGRALEEGKKSAEAIQQYEALLALNKTDEHSEKAFHRLGALYPPARALPHLKGFAARFPQSKNGTRAAARLAEVSFDQGSLDEAVAAYKQALAGPPEAAAEPALRYGLGWAYLKQGKPAEADAEFARLGDQPAAGEMQADAVLQRGEIAFQQKDFARAAARFQSLTNAPADRGERALYMLAWCRKNTGSAAESANTFRQLLAKFPEGKHAVDASMRLAELLQEKGETGEASTLLAGAVKRAGDAANEDLLHRYADALALSEKWTELQTLSEQMATRFPESDRRYLMSFRLGLAKKGLRLYTEAREQFQDTIKRTDTIEAAQAQFNIATTYYSEKNFIEAAKQFLRVELLYNYGDLSPKALYHAVDAFLQAEGAKSERAALYREKLRNNYADSEWTRKAAELTAAAQPKADPRKE